jgi:cytochrome c
MEGFGFNKIAGAVLATGLGVLVLNQFVGPALVHAGYPKEPAYKLPMLEEAAASGAEAAPKVDLATLLAAATPEQGAAISSKCKSCHTFDKGGHDATGPNLYGVLGRVAGTHGGYAYTAAMKGFGKTWDYDTLNTYLNNPRGVVPGTAMSFAGLKKPEERAAMIIYLRSLHDGAPPALPTPAAPEAAATPADGAPAAGTPAAPAAPAAPKEG